MRGEHARLWYATGEIASVLGVSRHTVRNLILAGDIKAQRTPGGHHRVSRDALAQFLRRRHGDERMLERWETRSKKPPHCWEYYARRPYDHVCADCRAHGREDAPCWSIHGMQAPPTCRNIDSCTECGYYRRFQNRRQRLRPV